MDASETDDLSVVGEEAHIVAQKVTGPRGNSELSPQQRNLYGNLILLCSVHHKVVDDHEDVYPVAKLNSMKRSHENWVRQNLQVDSAKQRDDEVYAAYVDQFIEIVEADEWKAWTSFVFDGGQPHIYRRSIRKLNEATEFVLTRVWSGRYPELERAFENFKRVANDFVNVFRKYMDHDREDRRAEEVDDWLFRPYRATRFGAYRATFQGQF